jgi:hypothetical protein
MVHNQFAPRAIIIHPIPQPVISLSHDVFPRYADFVSAKKILLGFSSQANTFLTIFRA